MVPYTPGNIYQCYLGGAVYNIDSISNQTATIHLTRNTTYTTGTAAKSRFNVFLKKVINYKIIDFTNR